MKIVFLWFMFLVLEVYSLKCKVFQCGNISQTEGESTKCIQPTNGPDFLAQKCDRATQHCSSDSWVRSGQADVGICMDNKPDIDPATRAPGDFCEETKDCFGNEAEVSCASNTCVTTRAVKAECPALEGGDRGHIWWPVGSYCATDTTCTPQLGEGGVWETGEACKYGYACVLIGDQTEYKWTNFKSVQTGTNFSIERIQHGEDKWIGYDNVWESLYSIVVDLSTRQCRGPDISLNISTLDNYTRSEEGEDCKYSSNSKLDNSDYFETSDESVCGFNINTDTYWRMRMGDQWFKETTASAAISEQYKLKWHATSYGGHCSDFINSVDKDIIFNFTLAMKAVDEDSGFPLIANNDKCVARTITTNFWQGRDPTFHPDSALGIRSMSVVALLMLIFLLV